MQLRAILDAHTGQVTGYRPKALTIDGIEQIITQYTRAKYKDLLFSLETFRRWDAVRNAPNTRKFLVSNVVTDVFCYNGKKEMVSQAMHLFGPRVTLANNQRETVEWSFHLLGENKLVLLLGVDKDVQVHFGGFLEGKEIYI